MTALDLALAVALAAAVAWAIYRALAGATEAIEELEVCPRCGRKVLALEYHLRRCLGRPVRFLHQDYARPFRRGERRDVAAPPANGEWKGPRGRA
jgi:hypothetical protein